jgi:hypothetical protein
MQLESVFARQVAAFNARDLEGFLATYADDAVVTSFGLPPLTGHAELRAHYEVRFTDESLHCRIDRTETFAGRWLVAEEHVTSAAGGTAVLGVFEIIDGRIQRASLLRA